MLPAVSDPIYKLPNSRSETFSALSIFTLIVQLRPVRLFCIVSVSAEPLIYIQPSLIHRRCAFKSSSFTLFADAYTTGMPLTHALQELSVDIVFKKRRSWSATLARTTPDVRLNQILNNEVVNSRTRVTQAEASHHMRNEHPRNNGLLDGLHLPMLDRTARTNGGILQNM